MTIMYHCTRICCGLSRI